MNAVEKFAIIAITVMLGLSSVGYVALINDKKNFESEIIEGHITDKIVAPRGSYLYFYIVIDQEHILQVRDKVYIQYDVGDVIMLESSYSDYWGIPE